MRGAYASRLFYEEQVQVPGSAEEEIRKTQRVFNEAVFGVTGRGGHAFVSYPHSYQLHEDGGLGHIDLMSRMKAEWASLCVRMWGREDSWKGLWRDALAEAYAGIPGLLEGNCSFKLFEGADASPVQKRAVAAWGSLPAVRGRVMTTTEEAGRREAGMAAATWEWDNVAAQPLFFNPWYSGGTRMSGRSTLEEERAAVAWATAGLRTWGDLISLGGGSLPSEGAVGTRVADTSWLTDLRREMPYAWKRSAMGSGDIGDGMSRWLVR